MTMVTMPAFISADYGEEAPVDVEKELFSFDKYIFFPSIVSVFQIPVLSGFNCSSREISSI